MMTEIIDIFIFTYKTFINIIGFVKTIFMDVRITSARNMCNIIIASVLEVFNTVFSILSLVSRSIVTGLNLGYTSSYSDSEPMKDGTAKPNEKAIHEQAFALV